MAYNFAKHDLGILRSDGTTTVGMMLVKNDDGSPAYAVYDDKYFAEQFSTGQSSYSNVDPQKELIDEQSDWRSGFGLEYWDDDLPKRYYASYGMDLRFKGMAIAGPTPTAVTLPTFTATDEANLNWETWTDATTPGTWTEDLAVTREATVVHGGSYACKRVATVTGWTLAVHQHITWNTEYQSRTFHFRGWGRSGYLNGLRFAIYDGVSRTYSGTMGAVVDTWEQCTWATKTLASNATELTLEVYYTGSGAEKNYYWDDMEFVDPTGGAPVAFAELSKKLYTAHGTTLSRLNAGGTAFDYIYSFPTDITDLETYTDGRLYIALGYSDSYWEMTETVLEDCEDAWNELVDTDVTSTADTDSVVGSKAVKLVVAAGAAANDILATEAITSTDITTYTHLHFQIKSSITLTSDQLRFLIDEAAYCANGDKVLTIPAVAADTWTPVYLNMGDVSALNAVISQGLEMEANLGAFTVRLDDVRVVKFTENTDANSDVKFLAAVFTTADTMYGSTAVNQVMRTTTPEEGGANAWGSVVTVGAAYHSITDLLEKNGAVYIPKEDMPYYLSSAGVVQKDLAPELASLTASTSGSNSWIWKNKLYIPCGQQGLLETDGTTNTFLNPASYCTNLTDFVGRVFAGAGDEEWNFVAVDNDTEVEILAGRSETIDSTTSWVWHPYAEITLAGVNAMHISSVVRKALWIASTSSTDSLYCIFLPTGYGDIENDANRKFKSDGCFIVPGLCGKTFPTETKAYLKATTKLGHSYDANIYFECHYMKLGDGDPADPSDAGWTDAGDLIGTATDRMPYLYIPDDGATPAIEPKTTTMWFKFVAKTDETTLGTAKTPIMLGYVIKESLYVPQRKIIWAVVQCKNEITLKDNTTASYDAATLIATIDEARALTWPFTFYDIDEDTSTKLGTARTVRMLPLPSNIPQWIPVKNEIGREIERHYNLLLLVTTVHS